MYICEKRNINIQVPNNLTNVQNTVFFSASEAFNISFTIYSILRITIQTENFLLSTKHQIQCLQFIANHGCKKTGRCVVGDPFSTHSRDEKSAIQFLNHTKWNIPLNSLTPFVAFK